jgi:hypothetical protein
MSEGVIAPLAINLGFQFATNRLWQDVLTSKHPRFKAAEARNIVLWQELFLGTLKKKMDSG